MDHRCDIGHLTQGRGQKVRTQTTCPPRGGSTPFREGVRQMEPRCDIGHRHTGPKPRGPNTNTCQQRGGGCAPTPPPQPTCTVPPWACPCAVGERRRWVGGRVGGWEVGRQHGERGGNQLWHHTTAFAPNVPHFTPPRGGRWSLTREPPRLLRAAACSDVAVVLTIFPPGSRPRAGRQWPTWLPGGVASRLMCPGRRLPPFATY